MSSNKRQWQEPVVKSIDQCQPIFGECRNGTTVTEGSPMQCNSGNGATGGDGECTKGAGATTKCTAGYGVNKP